MQDKETLNYLSALRYRLELKSVPISGEHAMYEMAVIQILTKLPEIIREDRDRYLSLIKMTKDDILKEIMI
jgi:hypothetical protein